MAKSGGPRQARRGVLKDPFRQAMGGGLFPQFFAASRQAMLLVDGSGEIRHANRRAEMLFGYGPGDLRERLAETLFPGQAMAAHLTAGEQETDVELYLELVGLRDDRSQFPAGVHVLSVTTALGRASVLSITDITDQQRASFLLQLGLEALGSADRDREALLGHLIRAQEEERDRIAAAIHDDTIQLLTGSNLALQQLRLRLRDPEHVVILDRLAETLSASMARLRQLIFDLRPTIARNGTITAALQDYLEQMHVDTGIEYRFEDSRTLIAPIRTSMLIYRTAREALLNVRKHAHAKHVQVELRDVADGSLVRIVDDGVGYSPADIEERPGHLGLLLMRERARAAGGWCRVESMPGGGTTVEFWVPVDRPRASGDGKRGRAA
jgi:PAS domain S-box-containing protein